MLSMFSSILKTKEKYLFPNSKALFKLRGFSEKRGSDTRRFNTFQLHFYCRELWISRNHLLLNVYLTQPLYLLHRTGLFICFVTGKLLWQI